MPGIGHIAPEIRYIVPGIEHIAPGIGHIAPGIRHVAAALVLLILFYVSCYCYDFEITPYVSEHSSRKITVK